MKRQCIQQRTRRLPSGAAAIPCGGPGETSWSTCSDEELLSRYAQHGTCAAFEELVRRYERKLYHHLRKYLRSDHLAEDAFQAVFLQVHLKCRDFDSRRQFQPWLYRMATNRAIDLLRTNRRWSTVRLGLAGGARTSHGEGRYLEEIADAHSTNPGQRLEAAENRDQFRRLAESLPARLREVVILVVLGGHPYQTAADMLGIPLGTVKSRLHEAMSQLRKILVPATEGGVKGASSRETRNEGPPPHPQPLSREGRGEHFAKAHTEPVTQS